MYVDLCLSLPSVSSCFTLVNSFCCLSLCPLLLSRSLALSISRSLSHRSALAICASATSPRSGKPLSQLCVCRSVCVCVFVCVYRSACVCVWCTCDCLFDVLSAISAHFLPFLLLSVSMFALARSLSRSLIQPTVCTNFRSPLCCSISRTLNTRQR